MPPARPTALYLHVPFCPSTCPYCDFNSITVLDRVDAYVDALCAELRAQAPRAAALDSVYLGGGTPSLLGAAPIARVLAAVRDAYAVTADCEWTIEANPATVTPAKAEAWVAGGISRVSVGAQSFDPAVLATLGRRHAPDAPARTVDVVRTAGVANVSLDLMYGVPGQSLASWRDTLAGAVALEPAHVSAYVLTIEKATPFGAAARAGRLRVPDDELVLQQRATAERRLADAGLAAYEISNYARPGFACRHNLAYWEHRPYLGCGAGAVGFDGRTRTRNLASVDAYVAAVRACGSGVGSRETLDADTLMFEHVLNGLRLRAGLDDRRFAARFGGDLAATYGATVAELRAGGFLEAVDGRWRLTARGEPVANEVALRFLR